MSPIKIGVIGVGRGQSFMRGAGEHVGMELVALCDTWEERLLEVGKQYIVATYTDYDAFLEHDMDAVVLANYFHEHAPFAIKGSQRNKCCTFLKGEPTFGAWTLRPSERSMKP